MSRGNDTSSEPKFSARGAQTELGKIQLIGKGGMSLVYRAWQPSLERFVAIKKMKTELVGNSEVVARFRREALALASVLHQNIAHVYDYVESAEETFILMEYIDGADVSTVLERTEMIPPRVAASILLGVAKGLAFIHKRNLVHRDIKPSNIRLTQRGEVKLMDFGIALDVDNVSLTRPGVMVGSPSYLSPEQILGDKVTAKSDIFLLGIVLYEMLTGVRPFREQGSETVFVRIRNTNYVPIRTLQPGAPKPLARIIERCLQKDPSKRYRRAEDLIVDLEQFLGHSATQPQKNILPFLEQEMIVEAQSDEFVEKAPTQETFEKTAWMKQNLKRVAAAALVLAGTFFAGYYMNSSSSSDEVHVQFPKPKATSKHLK